MTKIEQILEKFKFNAQKDDPIEVAIKLFNTPEGQEMLHIARQESEWYWQDWLHKMGDFRWHEFRPSQHICNEMARDWKLRQTCCTNCNGIQCTKTNNPYFLAELSQMRFGKEDTNEVINYLEWRPCKYCRSAITPQIKSSRNTRSDYL